MIGFLFCYHEFNIFVCDRICLFYPKTYYLNTTKISLALCEIIKHRIAPDMAAIAKQNLWYEQCALFELKNSKNDIDYKFIHQHVEFNNQYSYNIGLALFEQTQDLETLKLSLIHI